MLKPELLIEKSEADEEQSSEDAFHLGLGVLSLGYASARRQVEVRGIFRVGSWCLPEALDGVRSELLSLWREYAETLPGGDRAERRLRV